MGRIILSLITILVLFIYVIAWIQHHAGRRFGIRTKLDANLLVADLKKVLPKAQKMHTPKPPKIQSEEEWEKVRYYQKDPETGRFTHLNKLNND